MGYEPVFYKDKSIESDVTIISRLQKFMELYLSQKEHPEWFQEVIVDLKGNFHVPLGKYFFDEDVIKDKEDRIVYALQIVDQVIHEMESLTLEKFSHVIEKEIKGTEYEFDWSLGGSAETDAYNYQVDYIGCLEMLKRMMIGCHPHLSGYDH